MRIVVAADYDKLADRLADTLRILREIARIALGRSPASTARKMGAG
jgi:hypothetical protein